MQTVMHNWLRDTHTHAPQVWHPLKGAHVLIRSPAFLSSQKPSPTFLQLLDVPLAVFPDHQDALLLLTWPPSIALPNWQEAAALFALQFIHTLHTPGSDAHSEKKKKNQVLKEKKKHPGRNIHKRQVKQGRVECESWVCLCSWVAEVEFRAKRSVVCGSCRTSAREWEEGRAAALRWGDVAPLVFIAGWVAGR